MTNTPAGQALKPCEEAFERFLKEKHLSSEKDTDMWDRQIYKHPKIDAMYFAWCAAWEASRHTADIASSEGETSDGYHTFNELYEHRHALFIALLKAHPEKAWKSKKHRDGTMFDGWFIAGLETPDGQVTYHMPLRLWDDVEADVIHVAPEWDGHTSNDVISRIKALTRPATAQVETECPDCSGNGWIVGVEAVCCGNVYDSGECRSHCPVQEQVQQQCERCGGAGRFPLAEQPDIGAMLDLQEYTITKFEPDIEQGLIRFPSDMYPDSYLQIMQQDDGDMCLMIFDAERQHISSVEFCTASMGGGRNRALHRALSTFFMQAIKAAQAMKGQTK